MKSSVDEKRPSVKVAPERMDTTLGVPMPRAMRSEIEVLAAEELRKVGPMGRILIAEALAARADAQVMAA